MPVSSRSVVVGGSVAAPGFRRDVSKDLFWREAVAGRVASGLSIRDYCRQRGLSEASFYAWRRELALRDAEEAQREVARPPAARRASARGRSAKTSSPSPAFATVRVIEDALAPPVPAGDDNRAPAACAMQIIFPGQVRLQLHAPVEAAFLAEVLRLLREAPAC